MSATTPVQRFRQQVDALLQRGYPGLFGVTEAAFAESLEPLVAALPAEMVNVDAALGRVPFVLVIRSKLASVAQTLRLVRREGKPAIERLDPKTPADFSPIPAVQLPGGDAYLLVDVDRGAGTLNVTPDDADGTLLVQGRSPLTIEEGVALLTHHPDFLQPDQCFSLLGSRCGDMRVPTLTLSDGAPVLGWCWAGDAHNWLGAASCAGRAGSADLAVSSALS